MALKQDQERVKMLIQDTITLLCKNGLNYKNEFEIKALIGITIDKSDVILMDINRNIEQCPTKGKQSTHQKEQEDAASSNTHEPSYSVRKAHKKRKRGAADNSGSKIISGLIPDRDKDMNPAERGLSKDDQPARRDSEDDQPAAKTAKTTYDGHSVIAVKTEPTKTEPESDDNDDAADYSGWDETTEPEPGELSASEIRESQLEELSLSEIQSGELEEEDSPKTKQKSTDAAHVMQTRSRNSQSGSNMVETVSHNMPHKGGRPPGSDSLDARIEGGLKNLLDIKHRLKYGRHTPGLTANGRNNINKQLKHYMYVPTNDMLYIKWKKKLVEVLLTKERKQEVFDKAHRGHVGVNITIANIDTFGYWKQKSLEVKALIANCEACKAKRNDRDKAEKQRHELWTLPPATPDIQLQQHLNALRKEFSHDESAPRSQDESAHMIFKSEDKTTLPSKDAIPVQSQEYDTYHTRDEINDHSQDETNTYSQDEVTVPSQGVATLYSQDEVAIHSQDDTNLALENIQTQPDIDYDVNLTEENIIITGDFESQEH